MTSEERAWAGQEQIEFIDGTEEDVLAQSERFQQQFADGRMEGQTEGRKDERIAGLLAILRQWDMHLSTPMQQMLEQLPFEQLPPLELACTMGSVTEFAQRASLVNGHQLD